MINLEYITRALSKMKGLTDQEKEIIQRKFGIKTPTNPERIVYTQREIADTFGISREMVNYIMMKFRKRLKPVKELSFDQMVSSYRCCDSGDLDEKHDCLKSNK